MQQRKINKKSTQNQYKINAKSKNRPERLCSTIRAIKVYLAILTVKTEFSPANGLGQ